MYQEVETKTLGDCYTQSATTSDFSAVTLNDVPQGTALSTQWTTRFGQQYFLVGSRIKMRFQNQPNGVGQPIRPAWVRVLVLEARTRFGTVPPSSAAPMWTDTESNQVTWSPTMEQTPAVLDYRVDSKMYKVLYDRKKLMGAGSNASNGYGSASFDIWARCNKKVNVVQTSNGDGEQDRMLYLVYFTYDPYIIGTEFPPAPYTLACTWKTYFKDP